MMGKKKYLSGYDSVGCALWFRSGKPEMMQRHMDVVLIQ